MHNAPAGTCDGTPPRITVTPRLRTNREDIGTVSLAGLRRARGFKLRFTEPVSLEAFLVEPREEDPFTGADGVVKAHGGATVRIPVSPRRLRSWARRKKVDLQLLVEARDREGNSSDLDVSLRVTK